MQRNAVQCDGKNNTILLLLLLPQCPDDGSATMFNSNVLVLFKI